MVKEKGIDNTATIENISRVVVFFLSGDKRGGVNMVGPEGNVDIKEEEGEEGSCSYLRHISVLTVHVFISKYGFIRGDDSSDRLQVFGLCLWDRWADKRTEKEMVDRWIDRKRERERENRSMIRLEYSFRHKGPKFDPTSIPEGKPNVF